MTLLQVFPRANLRFQSAAILASQEAAEAYLVATLAEVYESSEKIRTSST